MISIMKRKHRLGEDVLKVDGFSFILNRNYYIEVVIIMATTSPTVTLDDKNKKTKPTQSKGTKQAGSASAADVRYWR